MDSILRHHSQIEAAFGAALNALDATVRLETQRALSMTPQLIQSQRNPVLTPALARVDQKAHASTAYEEQASAQMHMAHLEEIDPTDPTYPETVSEIGVAVAHHVYREEAVRYRILKETYESDEEKLSLRYMEEFDRYMGTSTPRTSHYKATG